MTYARVRPQVRLGNYELLEKLATGGMAEIYVARRVGPHGFSKKIALKRILPQLAADPEFVAMFIDEARVCAQLTHSNLVQVFDFGEDDGELYMAMELIEGTTCAKLVRAAAAAHDTIPIDVALHIALSVARGLEYAHDAIGDDDRPLGLVHRDVSPGNILISNAGVIKLGDFGIARAADFDRRTDQGQLKGKLGYMSPEQVTGKDLDAKSDQFAVAIVLAELLIARPLFAGQSELEILEKIRDTDLSMLDRFGRHIPDDVRAILLRALSASPSDRFATTSDLVQAIERVVDRRRIAVAPSRVVDCIDRLGLIKRTRSGEVPFEAPQPETARHSGHALQARAPSGARPTALVVERETTESGAAAMGAQTVAPEIYKIQFPYGTVGPVTFPRVAELFATGRIFRDTPVSRDESQYRRASDWEELGPLCTSLAKRWDAEIVAGATETWTIAAGEWPAQLFDMAVRRVTGLLTARAGDRQKKVFFVGGIPEFTASTEPRELLGSFLIERGTILPMEVEMALALAPRHGGRIGDALVGLGVLRPMELARAVVDQVRARFVDLVGWTLGDATFTPGARSQEETLPDAFPPGELIARGIVHGYSAALVAEIVEPMLGEIIQPLARCPFSTATLRLPPKETTVLDAIVEASVLEQIIVDFRDRGVADRVEVMRAVLVGLASGMLSSPGWNSRRGRSVLPTQPVPRPT